MTDTLTIRVATPDDLRPLDALFGRAYPRLLKADYPPSVLVTALPLISKAQPHLLRCGTFYVAQTETGWMVGAGGWTPRAGGTIGDVRHVVTDDRQVRRGVGRTLMSHAVNTARAAGIRLLDCKATRTAVPFYAAMGFVKDREITVPLRPGIEFPAVHMTLSL